MLAQCRLVLLTCFSSFFFFNDPSTTEIYTLSLHDALPISWIEALGTGMGETYPPSAFPPFRRLLSFDRPHVPHPRSEEHTSELQSHSDLVCRLLLEKKKNK